MRNRMFRWSWIVPPYRSSDAYRGRFRHEIRRTAIDYDRSVGWRGSGRPSGQERKTKDKECQIKIYTHTFFL